MKHTLGLLAVALLLPATASAKSPRLTKVLSVSLARAQVTGVLGEAAARAAMMPVAYRIERCAKRYSYARRAKLACALKVSPEGRVAKLRFKRKLRRASARMRRCVAHALRAAVFDRREKPSTVHVSFALRVATAFVGEGVPSGLRGAILGEIDKQYGGKPGATKPGATKPGATKPGATKPSGGKPGVARLDRQAIQKVIRANLRSVRACYARLLLRQPRAKGRVVMTIVVDPKGRVQSARPKRSNFGRGATQLEDCLMRTIARWRFPRPRGGGVVLVSYPFVFRQQ